MWLKRAKELKEALDNFMDEIEFRYDLNENEFYVAKECKETFGDDYDFLSALDGLYADLEYYIKKGEN